MSSTDLTKHSFSPYHTFKSSGLGKKSPPTMTTAPFAVLISDGFIDFIAVPNGRGGNVV